MADRVKSYRGEGARDSAREFERLYRESYQLVYNYVFRIVTSRAETEDIVSEAFLKAARSFGRFNASRAKFSTWVVAIARNCVADHYRSAKPHEALEDVPAGKVASEDSSIAQVDEADVVSGLFAVLDDDERTLVFMKYYECKRNVEIAEETGLNASTVSTKLARALHKMRAAAEGTV